MKLKDSPKLYIYETTTIRKDVGTRPMTPQNTKWKVIVKSSRIQGGSTELTRE